MLLLRLLKPRLYIQLHQQTIRRMALVNVKCTDDEDRIQMSFVYGHNGGFKRTFNANRPKTETLESTLRRIGDTVAKKSLPKKKKKKSEEPQQESSEEQQIKVCLFLGDGLSEISLENTIQEALQQGNIMTVNGEKYTVNLNPPNCVKVSIPDSIMVGFPIFPSIELEFADLNDSELVWSKQKVVDNPKSHGKEKKSPKLEIDESVKCQICTELSYVPTNNDIGYRLCFSVTPKDGTREGETFEVQSKYDVTAGPGFCPYENRHQYTQKLTDTGEFRVISYNILADLYASQEYSREVLFNYCPPYALELDYRKHLILGELKGYNGDLVCLQEVDKKFFENGLLFAMETLGLDGSFLEKGDKTREGSAIFYRKSKFRLLEEHCEVIRDILEKNPICQDIVKKVFQVSDLKEVLQSRTTVLHIMVLEPIERPGQVVIVANTHLYFHPKASHVRMVQALTAMRYIDTLMAKYKKQKPCLVFCGDFNSSPNHAIYEFMTTKEVKGEHQDWNAGGPDQYVADMNYSHMHNIGSGCGLPAYTNYTPGFNGHLDYIFYNLDRLEVVQVIPPPDHKDVELNSGLPSITFPSDHIAQICDFKWK